MLVLVAAHALAALAAPALVRALDRRAFALLAVVPAAAVVWIVLQLPAVLAGAAPTEVLPWIPVLGVDLALRLDPLAATVSLLVTGVGALVLVYCTRYFPPGARGMGRFAAVLTAFAGAMLALVWSDDVFVLYVCWELTTVFSFLLVGQDSHKRASRAAAVQALVVTAAGGLTMLVGLVVLAQAAGTSRLSGLVAYFTGPAATSAAITAGVVCVLVGAITKSALVPFHFWLPSAMAAPTPVSAYLHAAAMVKAGVYLVLRLAPGLADVEPWRPLVAAAAVTTMLLGGVQALRQHDLKLVLAHGTVSQLGLMILLAGAGTRDAALAAVGLVVAHALFKACLFLVVGVIDRRAGTRDLRELSGLGRRAPVLATAGVLGASSMAGLPPLLGFVTKEGAFEAFLHEAYGAAAVPLLVLVVLGSVLTVGYSARFVWGAFWRKPGVEPVEWRPAGVLFPTAPVVLAGAGLAAGVGVAFLAPLLVAYADTLPASYPVLLELKVVPSIGTALGLSVLAVALGLVVGLPRVSDLLTARHPLAPVRAEITWRGVIHALENAALRVTVSTQRGSLSWMLTVIFVVLVLGPGAALLLAADLGAIRVDRLADSPFQVLAAVIGAACAIVATRVRRRLGAVIVVGGLGYATALIFALAGAPDVALTQALVETATLVVVVLVLRTLPRDISDRHTPRERARRLLVAVPVGVLMTGLGAVALAARQAPPVSAAFPAQAYGFGAGQNVVNVTLVDIRAWDTMGELSVIVAAATGVASLVFLHRRSGVPPRSEVQPVVTPSTRAGGWLRSARRNDGDRVLLLEVVARLVFPTMMVVSLYFLFAGHNAPGGGFAGGLVAGLALVVRYVAGGRHELGEAVPVDAGLLLGLGLLCAGGTGIGALLLGGEVLQSAVIEGYVPVLGNVKFVTSLIFDVGVYLIVVGLVLDVLRSLGAELDRRRARVTEVARRQEVPS
ncbi:Na+/H+ antiporter subunit A [Actinomycetospora cinnamomea]|uniref:Multisubunit sodium/proton antiporter MrpA subunit /multisubunit sodium/proton antiporter MrpB subunit n=1 Tax=Actinomycetospora cinnamomea TaxID=663609 RepID=A0A2U1FD86_9PSEU|nr:Na+/H+ antiporter subunit A [Actinomycetospora cinnamomea]PVZ10108.1 multisubunit sodium/proton antiporter MrpA subunit /multisubunit sodium/proton antiporter MrpB subunit [Actinomycetospora cinnamomea]